MAKEPNDKFVTFTAPAKVISLVDRRRKKLKRPPSRSALLRESLKDIAKQLGEQLRREDRKQ